MSRHGYNDDIDNWQLIKWRGQVASATRGRRGQKMLSDLIAALDAMPDKRLISKDLETADGEVCALGALGRARGLDMRAIDPEEPDQIANAFDVAPQLAREIVYHNDECDWGYFGSDWRRETPEERWSRMRKWAELQITAPTETTKNRTPPHKPNTSTITSPH